MTNGIIIPETLTGTRFSTDTENRLMDILISQGLDFTQEAQVTLAFGNREREVTGAQKLVQKWIIAFLTKAGSVQGDDNFGSFFMTRLEQGRVVTDADVQVEFADAAARVQETLDDADVDNPNADERLQLAELRDFELTKTTLNLRVRIVSQAGEGTTVILPVPLEA